MRAGTPSYYDCGEYAKRTCDNSFDVFDRRIKAVSWPMAVLAWGKLLTKRYLAVMSACSNVLNGTEKINLWLKWLA
jgi:hypothetical protein